MIPARDMDAYRAQVDALGDRAASAVRAFLAAELGGIDPAALDVAAVRDAAIAALGGILDVYAVAGASAACGFMERHGMPPQTLQDADRRAIERVVRYQAGKLAEGDVDGFIEQVCNFARDSVGQAANRQQMKAAERGARRRGGGKGAGVRFARVPNGTETCAFCYMLASRGFVYWTRETAGEMDHFHRGCDCKVVASNDPDGIEHYDPEGMRQRMALIEEETGLSFSNKKDLGQISKDMELRSLEWLYGGVAEGARAEKDIGELYSWEKKAVELLSRKGYAVVLPKEEPTAPANIDCLIGGQLWELKNVGDGKHSIEDQLRKARGKWTRLSLQEPVRVVVSCYGRTKSDKSAIDEIIRRSRYWDNVLFISNDERTIKWIKK